MHPCLCIDEILRIIAHELVGSGGKATAVSLAYCCKGFEDPALDALWATQDRLLPLFKTFPTDIWSQGGLFVSVSASVSFSFLDSEPAVLQKVPDSDRMGSLPEVRAEDTRAQRPRRFGFPIC